MSKSPDRIITYKDDHDDKGKVEIVNKKKEIKKAKISDKMTLGELEKLILKKIQGK